MLGQDINWDLQNYHLYNPYAFLNDRIEFDLAPAGLQSWFNPLLDLAYFFAISHLSPKTVGFLIGFIQGLNFLLVYKIAVRLLPEYRQKHLISLGLALGGVLSVGFLAQVGTTMHDSTVALFPLLSLWIILKAIDPHGKTSQHGVYRLIGLAGLVSGIGVGLKLVTAIYALPLCVSLLIIPVHWLERLKLSFLFGLAVLIGFFVTGSWWMFEMWRLFGNPLFPNFNNLFQGELANIEPIRDIRFLPNTLYEKIFYPIIFTFNPQRVAELKYEQFSWLAVYIGLVVLVCTKAADFLRKGIKQKPLSMEAAYLLTFFLTSFLLWLNLFGIYRYLAVLDLLIPLLLFLILTVVLKTHHSQVLALALIALLTMVNLPGAPDWWHNDWADTVYHIEPSELTTGTEPAAIYLAGQPGAWIIPALDIQSPFIQIIPNFPITEAYWQRARKLTESRKGKRFVIYGGNAESEQLRLDDAVMRLGISIDDDSCGNIIAYMGAGKFEFRFCEVKLIE